MSVHTGKIRKIAPWTLLIIGALMLISAFVLNALPDNVSYVYDGGEIIEHSWRDVYRTASAVVLIVVLLLSVAVTAVNVRSREKTASKTFFMWLMALVCAVLIAVSNLGIVGIEMKDVWEPVCYEFTDGNRTIVIEEKSFILAGEGTVYQVESDGTAVVIGEFSTDDGGRNNGEYGIKWREDSAEITYHTFVSSDATDVIIVEFVK